MRLTYPYTCEGILVQPAFPGRNQRYRPLLDLTLYANGKSITLSTLVDTGADVCVFPADVAAALQIKIPNSATMKFGGVDATAPDQTAYFVDLEAGFMPLQGSCMRPIKEIRFKFRAGFGPFVSGPVVGQVGFFDQFKASFDHPTCYTLERK